MKKRLLIILALIMAMLIVSSCVNHPEGSNVPAGDDKSETTAKESEETDPPESQTEEKKEPLSLNLDFFNEYGMTYGELREKHGKMISFGRYYWFGDGRTGVNWPEGITLCGGDMAFLLKNGYGYYVFDDNFREASILRSYETDPEDGSIYIELPDELVCTGVLFVNAMDLFNTSAESLTLEEISEIEGFELLDSKLGWIDDMRYASAFRYSGWDEEIIIYISHRDENVINSWSEASFFLVMEGEGAYRTSIPNAEEDPENDKKRVNTKVEEDGHLSLNLDFFNVYGMTYGELKERDGELVGLTHYAGGIHHRLENGYGSYRFYKPTAENVITHPEYGFSYPEVKDDEICTGIIKANAMDMFNTSAESLTLEEIANLEGLELLYNERGRLNLSGYTATFVYSGWNDERVPIYVYHDEENVIDIASKVEFYLHPQYLEQETDSE